MEVVNRHRSVHFNYKSLGKIEHDNVKMSLLDLLDEDNIKSIQITSKMCVVTCDSMNSKHTLVTEGLTINDRNIKVFEVEKTITNVTIKDAPYELEDKYITSSMSKYGQIVQDSLR